MKKSFISFMLTTFLCMMISFALVGCGENDAEKKGLFDINMSTVYALAQESGYTGTLEDLIEAFKGDSAYQIAVNNGYTGMEVDWLKTLIGATGAKVIRARRELTA